MQKLHFEILIDAPREKVWNTIINDKPFREWNSVFAPGSHFEGRWEKGARMRFTFVNEQGKIMGAVAEIAECRPHEFISIKHIGLITDGIEDTTSEKIKKWAPAYENYTLSKIDGRTKLTVEMDSDETYLDMFNDTWPRALEKIKELSEE